MSILGGLLREVIAKDMYNKVFIAFACRYDRIVLAYRLIGE